MAHAARRCLISRTRAAAVCPDRTLTYTPLTLAEAISGMPQLSVLVFHADFDTKWRPA
jgi:hypothetical protein